MISKLYVLRPLALHSISRLSPRAQGSVCSSNLFLCWGQKRREGVLQGSQSMFQCLVSSARLGNSSVCNTCHLRGSCPHKTFSLYFHQVDVSLADTGASWKCKKKKRLSLQISVLLSCVYYNSHLHLDFLCFLLGEGDT